MRISITEIRDYIRCPLSYKFIHINNLSNDKTLNDYYKEYLKLSIFFYYFSLIEKNPKPFEMVLKKWESLWFSSDMLSMFHREDLDRESNRVVLILTNYYKKIYEEKTTPIAVNLPYEVVFEGQENIHVTGDIDLIQIIDDRTRKRETQIVSIYTAHHRPDSFMAKNNLNLSAASYAFRKNFKTKEDKIVIDHVQSKEQTITTRSGGDFIRLEKIVRNICKGIKENIFYPTANKMFCSNCKFKLFCINEKAI